MAAKLALIGLIAMATAGLLSLMVTWWSGPIDRAGGFPVTMGQLTMPVTDMPGAWIISNKTITPSGHVFVLPDVAACQTGTQQQCDAFLATQHLRQQIAYQPASRFWAFQAYETAIFGVLALALAGFCIWWIRYRRLVVLC